MLGSLAHLPAVLCDEAVERVKVDAVVVLFVVIVFLFALHEAHQFHLHGEGGAENITRENVILKGTKTKHCPCRANNKPYQRHCDAVRAKT